MNTNFFPFSEFDEASEQVYKLCKLKITEAAEEIKKKKVENNADVGEKSLLEKLFIAVDKKGAHPDIPMLMAMGTNLESIIFSSEFFMIFFLFLDGITAGMDTTAHTTAFLMYNLACHPEKQEILYQEISSVVGKGNVTEAHLSKMRCEHIFCEVYVVYYIFVELQVSQGHHR